MVAAPDGRPVALTLALSRRAGEGTRCCLRGYFCDGGGRGGSRTAPTVAVHNHRHSGESRNPEGPGNGEAHVI